MGARTIPILGALAAALLGGCTTPFRVVWNDRPPPVPGKSSPDPIDNPAPVPPPGSRPEPPPPAYPSGVIPAGGVNPAAPGTPVLPPPTPLGAGAPNGPAVPPATGGTAVAPVPGVPLGPDLGPTFGPHVRPGPTAGGALFNLEPPAHPLDRLLELTRRIDTLTADNAIMHAKLREQDAFAAVREQQLNEAVRLAEEAKGAVARAEADVLAARADAAAARARLAQVEKEDVDFLRALVEALNAFLNPPKRKEP